MQKLGDLIKKSEIMESSADLDLMIRGISFNSGSLVSGDLFVAIKGLKSDGHNYVGDAAEKGAVCVICEKVPETKIPYILVKDSRKALAELSSAWFGYPSEKMKMVGVTGTNGKTTVTTLLKQVLESCGKGKVGLIGTNKNMIGDKEVDSDLTTPESYEVQKLLSMMLSEDCQVCVMEVSSHALELSRVHGIIFDVGIFTNLSQDHLDFHGTMEAYANAKARLFSISRNSVINIDDEYAEIMTKSVLDKVYTYAINEHTADLSARDIKFNAEKVEFLALETGSLERIELNIPGMFSVYNAMAVIAASSVLGVEVECAAQALKTCKGVKGRAEVIPTGKDFTVIIDYAHTPDALENITKTARELTNGRVVTLFGCGGDRDKAKRPLMAEAAAKYSDYIIVTSDNPRGENPSAIIDDILIGLKDTTVSYTTIENRREAIHWAINNAEAEDVIILAGKGHETYQIIGKEKRHFDEREVVLDALSMKI
jgi:UDP-N-acetylmuramoyl-L-alanyl-D-glutamate--2,6-diaminopimelate ligase